MNISDLRACSTFPLSPSATHSSANESLSHHPAARVISQLPPTPCIDSTPHHVHMRETARGGGGCLQAPAFERGQRKSTKTASAPLYPPSSPFSPVIEGGRANRASRRCSSCQAGPAFASRPRQVLRRVGSRSSGENSTEASQRTPRARPGGLTRRRVARQRSRGSWPRLRVLRRSNGGSARLPLGNPPTLPPQRSAAPLPFMYCTARSSPTSWFFRLAAPRLGSGSWSPTAGRRRAGGGAGREGPGRGAAGRHRIAHLASESARDAGW